MKKTILIIDDEPDSLALVRMRIEASGYKVLTAENYEDAFNLMKRQIPDLVLLDVVMPGMNGYEVCNQIKNNDKTKDVPVVLFTANPEQKTRLESNAEFIAADDCIQKPFEPDELVAKIKKFIG
jgi:DNA-binding response OmpR family regulator